MLLLLETVDPTVFVFNDPSWLLSLSTFSITASSAAKDNRGSNSKAKRNIHTKRGIAKVTADSCVSSGEVFNCPNRF